MIKGSIEERLFLEGERRKKEDEYNKAVVRAQEISEKIGEVNGCLSALRRCDQVIEDWERCIEWMSEKEKRGEIFLPSEIAARALQSLIGLSAAIQWGVERVELQPRPSLVGRDDEEIGEMDLGYPNKADESTHQDNRDDELKENIIKLMAKAGTERDGLSAAWNVSDIKYGLSRIYSDIDYARLKNAIRDLLNNKDIRSEVCISGLDNEMGYILCDKHAVNVKKKTVDELIMEFLQSARDNNGDFVVWTRNQLYFALKREVILSEKDLDDAISKLSEQDQITTKDVNRNLYISIKPQDMLRHLRFMEKQGLIRPKDVDCFESETDQGRLDSVVDDLLSKMRGQPKRLWRDYDLDGLYKDGPVRIVMVEKDGSIGLLNKALDTLVACGLVEKVLRDSQSWIKEDRWLLTDSGKEIGLEGRGE